MTVRAPFVVLLAAVFVGCEGSAGKSAPDPGHDEAIAPAAEASESRAPVAPVAVASSAIPVADARPAASVAGTAEPRLRPLPATTPTASAASGPPANVVTAPSASAPAPPAPEPPPTRSAEQNEPSFRLWAQSSGRYRAGTPGHFDVVLVPSGDYHCNPSYPYKLTLGPAPAAVSFPSPVVRADAMAIAEKRAVMSVPILPSAVGAATVTGRFALSVCTSQVCHTETRDVALTITVE